MAGINYINDQEYSRPLKFNSDTTSKLPFERALIVRKEWLDKIFDEFDPKLWEMRSTKTNVRGTVGLIEAGTGLIVGSVEISTCYQNKVAPDRKFIKYHKVEDTELLNKWCYAWVLSNAKRFDEPIPYTHPKGAVIWVKLDNYATLQ